MGTPSTSSLGDQVRVGWRTWATRSSSWLSIELDLLLLCSYVCLGCLLPLERPISPSSGTSVCLFLLRSGLGFSPRSTGSWGGGGFTGGLDLLLSWGVTHVSYNRGRSLDAQVLVHFFLGFRYNNSYLLKLEPINFSLKRRGRCSPFLGNSLCKWHVLKWLSGKRNSLWNGVIDWWKVVWSPRDVYMSQMIVVCSDRVADV